MAIHKKSYKQQCQKKLSKWSACSPPFIILTVLLCLILTHMFVIEECRSCSSSICVSSTAKTGLSNFTEWADDVVSKVSNNVSQSFSKCNVWADMVNNCTNGTHSINERVIESVSKYFPATSRLF